MRYVRLAQIMVLWLALAIASTAHAGDLDDGVRAFKNGDYATAHRLLRPLADQGDATAETLVGNMYVFGEGVSPEQVSLGMNMLHKAADAGNPLADYELGFVYDNAGPRGPSDKALPVAWYRKAAAHDAGEEGVAEAQLRMARLYLSGSGVSRDPKAAAMLFRKAAIGLRWRADRGDTDAAIQLANLYDQGQVAPADPGESARLMGEVARRLTVAAESGDPFAQTHLSELYRFGNGVPADKLRTVLWLRRAADQGDAQAQLSLGAFYIGSPLEPSDDEDRVQAMVWVTLAARARSWLNPSLATDLSTRMAKLLSPEQQAEVARRIDAWRPAAEPRTQMALATGDDALSIAITPAQRAEAARLQAKWRTPTTEEKQAALAAAHAFDMSLGSPNARVTVVEYATIGSPAAARFNNEVLPHFKARYLDTGRVRFIFRELPISGNASIYGYLAARCAGPDRYFSTLDAIYRANPPVEEGDPDAVIAARLASITGLSPERLGQCLSDQAAITALRDRTRTYTDIERLEVAPTFEIDGRRVEGVMTAQQMDAAVDRASAAKQ